MIPQKRSRCWYAERREQQVEDEQVVDGERLLDDVAGQERGGRAAPEPPEDERVEEERDGDPDRAPDRGFADADHVRLAVENPEVERQHGRHDHREHRPEHGASD
jgi:hypothetical protein